MSRLFVVLKPDKIVALLKSYDMSVLSPELPSKKRIIFFDDFINTCYLAFPVSFVKYLSN